MDRGVASPLLAGGVRGLQGGVQHWCCVCRAYCILRRHALCQNASALAQRGREPQALLLLTRVQAQRTAAVLLSCSRPRRAAAVPAAMARLPRAVWRTAAVARAPQGRAGAVPGFCAAARAAAAWGEAFLPEPMAVALLACRLVGSCLAGEGLPPPAHACLALQLSEVRCGSHAAQRLEAFPPNVAHLTTHYPPQTNRRWIGCAAATAARATPAGAEAAAVAVAAARAPPAAAVTAARTSAART